MKENFWFESNKMFMCLIESIIQLLLGYSKFLLMLILLEHKSRPAFGTSAKLKYLILEDLLGSIVLSD